MSLSHGSSSLDEHEVSRIARCSACGACDAQLGPEDPWDRGLVGPPSRWTRALAESPGLWAQLQLAIAHVPDERARAMEARCHVLVPFTRLRAKAHAGRPRPGPKKKRTTHDPG